MTTAPRTRHRGWPAYRTVWRWHFYAGLFCLPFVVWLAVTGAIYLFKPQVEAWLDRDIDAVTPIGPALPPSRLVEAARAAVPGSVLNSYQLPSGRETAVRVLVGRDAFVYRVYVRPDTAEVLYLVREDQRFMRRIFYLHGELLLGAKGSMLVELAASWTVVLLVTGLYLWWPRDSRLAGVVYPRFRSGRAFWRDVHAVAGFWISAYTLFLLLSGLPWAKSWGSMLKQARTLGSSAALRLDWTTGSDTERAESRAMNTPPRGGGEHDGHGPSAGPAIRYDALDRMVPTVAALALTPPVLISPPSQANQRWSGRSDAPNRPKRVTLVLDPSEGGVISRTNFADRPVIDRAVGIGVAAHEGQLFGWLNQLLGLANALGLVIVAVSAAVMWWRRRAPAVLGAPAPVRGPRLAWAIVSGTTLLGVVLPLFGATLLGVVGLERLVLRHNPWARRVLGLAA